MVIEVTLWQQLCRFLDRQVFKLTHRSRVTHICFSKLSIIASDNGLSPGRLQAIIWTNDGIGLIWSLGTNYNEILTEIQTFSYKRMHLKMSSSMWWPFCLGPNVLNAVFLLEACKPGACPTNDISIEFEIQRNLQCSHSWHTWSIPMKFCTCHKSSIVMTCAKFYCDPLTTF